MDLQIFSPLVSCFKIIEGKYCVVKYFKHSLKKNNNYIFKCFPGFLLEFENIYMTSYSKMTITFPGHLYLKILWKANTDFFWVWTLKLKASLFLILCFLDDLQGSSASLRIEWVNLLPSRLFVSVELYSFILKGTFPFKATQVEKFSHRKRINHVFVILYTK